MNFIFPKNFNFKSKFLGVFDYTSIFLNVFWCFIVFFILHFISININFKIFLFILICFPIFLISISGFNGESFILFLSYFLKYLFKQKLYFYEKK